MIEDFDVFIGKIFKNINDIRVQKKISYQELAYRCDIDKSNLISIITLKKNITVKTLHKLCRGLDIDVCEIMKQR